MHGAPELAILAPSDRLSRRTVVRAGAGLVLAGGAFAVPMGAARAQSATPEAVATLAPPDPARVDKLMALSTVLVGGGRLDPNRGAQFVQLADTDAALSQALDAALALDPVTVPADATNAPVVTAVLQFWYLGVFQGAAVPDRASFWYGLSSWQAVKYTSSTSICKIFGDWADAPRVV